MKKLIRAIRSKIKSRLLNLPNIFTKYGLYYNEELINLFHKKEVTTNYVKWTKAEKALAYCIANNHLDVIKLLHKKGINLFLNNSYFLNITNKAEVMRYLLTHNLSIKEQEGWLMTKAVAERNAKIIQLLIHFGDNSHVKTSFLIDSISKTVSVKIEEKEKDTEVIQVLINNGANIHANRDGLIRKAVKDDNVNLVKYLISKKADIHRETEEEESAWLESVRTNKVKIVDAILSSEITQINKDEAFRTAIHCQSFDVADRLLKTNININNDEGRVIKEAARYNNYESIDYLLANNIDVKASKVINDKNISLEMVAYLENYIKKLEFLNKLEQDLIKNENVPKIEKKLKI